MPRLALALAATLALAGCGGGDSTPDAGADAALAAETLCDDGLDSDGDGLTDCDDPDCGAYAECTPVTPPACTRQRDCGNIVNEIVTNCCLDQQCVPPGPGTLKNKAVTAQVYFDLSFNSTLTGTRKPQTVAVRFIYPETLDGAPLTCAEVVGKLSEGTKNCVDETTRSILDTDPEVNQVFRNLYTLNWGCTGTTCEFPNMIATVPRGQYFILYGEAWLGARSLNDPTGQCLAYYCLEGQTVGGNDQHFRLSFSAQ